MNTSDNKYSEIEITIPDDLRSRIEAVSSQEGISVQQFTTLALTKGLTDFEEIGCNLKDLELELSLVETRRDLRDNKFYNDSVENHLNRISDQKKHEE